MIRQERTSRIFRAPNETMGGLRSRSFSRNAQRSIRCRIDTLIVGEDRTGLRSMQKSTISQLFPRSYATETIGVRALARHLAEKHKLPWTFVSAPTGL